MKVISKITLGLVTATLLMTGCVGGGAESSSQADVKAAVSEESLGLRKTDLYSEDATIASKTEYRRAQATTSNRIARAFQDAPPMIPHDTTGMLPIKADDNQCVGCHMPDVAVGIGATPIPVSHFTDFRPRATLDAKGEVVIPVNNMKNETMIVKKDELQNARFNCSQCHAPQSQGNLAVENTFEPVFLTGDGEAKSAWQGAKFTESLNTIIGGDSTVTADDLANKHSAAGGGSSHH